MELCGWKGRLTDAITRDIRKTIGERQSMRIGRMIEILKSCLGVRPVSRAERRFSFPVSLRRRSVRFLRMTYG